MPITDWPEHERPRERLLRHGASRLSDAELLAIFLRTGVAGKSALDLARGLLARFDGSLRRLADARFEALAAESGIGPAKASQLMAVVELVRRGLVEELEQATGLSSPQAVRDYLRLALEARPHEVFMVLCLDAQNRLIARDELFRGTLTQTSVYPREVVKLALARNAAAVIFAHNHVVICDSLNRNVTAYVFYRRYPQKYPHCVAGTVRRGCSTDADGHRSSADS